MERCSPRRRLRTSRRSSTRRRTTNRQPKDFLPEGAIKVGGSWTVPAEKSERIFKTFRDEDMKINVKKSTIAGKLLKVYKKDGAHFGVIEATLTLVTTEMNLGGQFIKTEAGSKLVFIGMMDVCIDGSNPTEDNKATMTGDITLDHPAVGLIKIKGATAGVKKVHRRNSERIGHVYSIDA